jgi:hypothetical protein
MALRNQPYFPFYVNDFTSDEKLILCSAESTGVYIRIMCLMHKSDEYGVILLKQNFKQSSKQEHNFALLFAKFMPYDLSVIESALDELIAAGVLILDGDRLYQKRMVKDEKISQLRVEAGRKGGLKTQKSISRKDKKESEFATDFDKAKNKANTEYGYVNETVNKDSSFDVFWKAYPRKTAKEDARKAYAVLMKKKDAPTIDRLIESIEAHKRSEAWKKDDGQFIPHPATYIRQGRYDDEIKMQGGVRRCKLDENGEIVYES